MVSSSSLVKAPEMMRGLEDHLCEQRLGELALVGLEEKAKNSAGCFVPLQNPVNRETGPQLLPAGCRQKTRRRDCQKLQQRQPELLRE